MLNRILLIEDNELIRELLKRWLHLRGYQPIVAENGQEGLILAQAESPALILVDLGLPDLDGWMVIERLRSLASTSNIPIIALTAHALTQSQEQAWVAGCDEYETKPVNFFRLLGKIKTLLVQNIVVPIVT